jgi:hypothetical protein
MSGPTFASTSFEEVRERLESATPASTAHRGGGERRDGLAAILHLGCIAMVGALTIGVFFGLAFYFLAHPIDQVIATSGARHRWGEALTRWVLTGSAPVVRVGSAPPAQPTQPGTTGEPEQGVQIAAVALASPAELRPVQVRSNPGPKRIENATAEIVSGPVTEVRDAMTWVVGGQVLHLWGIRPGLRAKPSSLASFVARVSSEGAINCHRQAHSTRYRCSTAAREDIAETELLAGIGRAADGATVAYRGAEVQARAKGRGRSASR